MALPQLLVNDVAVVEPSVGHHHSGTSLVPLKILNPKRLLLEQSGYPRKAYSNFDPCANGGKNSSTPFSSFKNVSLSEKIVSSSIQEDHQCWSALWLIPTPCHPSMG
ncbi:hypothetical protein V2J09_006725 [Rumex salicifolius]